MIVTRNGKKLTIVADLTDSQVEEFDHEEKAKKSSSGKSKIRYSTSGFTIADNGMKVSINITSN